MRASFPPYYFAWLEGLRTYDFQVARSRALFLLVDHASFPPSLSPQYLLEFWLYFRVFCIISKFY